MGTLIMCVPLLLSLVSLLLLPISIFIQWPWRFAPPHHPGPISYPMIGCLISFYKNRRRLLDWYTDLLSASPSQTIVVSRLGARRTIVTANPRNVEYILKTNFTNFPKGKAFTDILGDFLGHGIFNVDGDMWYNQRKLVVHHFTATSLRAYVEKVLINEVEKKLLPAVESAAAEGRPVDLQELLRRFAFDLVCRVSLGYNPCCLEYGCLDAPHPILEAFDTASDICARRGAAPLSAAWKIKRFLDYGSERRLREAIGKIHLFVDGIVGEKKREMMSCCKKGEERWEEMDLASKMVWDGIDEEVVRDTMISLIMAGRDTTSAAMTWLFYLLSCHPHVESEVARELLTVLQRGDNTGRFETLRELRWLKACICESMRLFPPVAWDSKHAVANDELPDGTRVRAGDRVTYFPYGMGRMKSLWGEDRFEFKPERWVSEEERGRIKALKNYGPYKFSVFQAGPRACPGKEMAFVQMKYVVASIVERFVIRPVVPDRPIFVPLLTAHMATGFKVLVRPRQ
ncbi:cytochrome P450 94B3 [Salvia miltiorrhiza]|uniref:cytochrome P450 94B3 n=1 Tax=Salvia miltiorrhiza TaxID=226208 RepID=UPI0025AC0F91|nr:cytochrome P450 94B3 [Salvia miltiorrhiza]